MLPLCFEYVFFFQLSPYKISLFSIFRLLEPKPPFHQGSDEIAVVPLPNKNPEGFFILDHVKVPENSMVQVDNKDKLFVFVDFLCHTGFQVLKNGRAIDRLFLGGVANQRLTDIFFAFAVWSLQHCRVHELSLVDGLMHGAISEKFVDRVSFYLGRPEHLINIYRLQLL
jgi:hypothetical protein